MYLDTEVLHIGISEVILTIPRNALCALVYVSQVHHYACMVALWPYVSELHVT